MRKFIFEPLPGGRHLRPVIPFTFARFPKFEMKGLIDSGAVATRVHADIAEYMQIDLSGIEPVSFVAGGGKYYGRTVPTQLSVDGFIWEAPVCFTEEWELGYQLLGLRGFFDTFVVRIEASKLSVKLSPSRQPIRGPS